MRLSGSQMTFDLAGQNHKPAKTAPQGYGRELAAVLRLLPAEDRRLAELVFIQNQTQRAAAEAIGIDAGTAGRRLTRLRSLFACPTRRAVAVHLDALAPEVRQQAVDHFFLRYSVSLMAQQRGVARSVVQREVDYLRGWARGLQRVEGDEERAQRSAQLEQTNDRLD